MTADFTRFEEHRSHIEEFGEAIGFGSVEFEPDKKGKGAFKRGQLKVYSPFAPALRGLSMATWLGAKYERASLEAEGADKVGHPLHVQWGLAVGLEAVSLAATLYTMQQIGKFRVKIFGKPFEYVQQQLMVETRLWKLTTPELRTIEFRNDFISEIADLKALGRKHLRREILKDQLFQIEMVDDPFLEVDNIIETSNGDRYYITAIRKTMARDAEPLMSLEAWKISDGWIRENVESMEPSAVSEEVTVG